MLQITRLQHNQRSGAGLPKLRVISLGRRKLVLQPTLDEWLLLVEGVEGYDGGRLDSTPKTHGKGVDHHA